MSSIDWASTGIWMQAWAGFAGAAAILYAAWRGGTAFENWQLQKVADRKFEIGEQTLITAFSAQEAYKQIRAPFHSAQEIQSAEEALKENVNEFEALTEERKSCLKTSQTIFDRMNHHSDIWLGYQKLRPSIQVYFSDDTVETMKSLFLIRSRITAAAHSFARSAHQANAKHREHLEAVIFDGLAESDPISEEVDKLLDTIKKEIEPLLSARLKN